MLRRFIALLGASLVAACGPANVEEPSASPTTAAPIVSSAPTPTPSPTPTPTPTAFPSYPADLPTEDPVKAAIIAGWQEYQRVYDAFAADPLGFDDFAAIQRVTTGEEARGMLESLEVLVEERIRASGGQMFRDVTVEMIDDARAEVRYCLDLSEYGISKIDSGEEVPPVPNLRETASMELGNDGVWRVSRIRNSESKC